MKTKILISVLLAITATSVVFIYSRSKENIVKNVAEVKEKVCSFVDDRGVDTTAYIKESKIRIISKEENGNVLIDGDMLYIWDDAKKEGFVYKKDNGEILVDKKQYIDLLEKYNDHCKTESVDDKLFRLPEGVNISDINKMILDLKNRK